MTTPLGTTGIQCVDSMKVLAGSIPPRHLVANTHVHPGAQASREGVLRRSAAALTVVSLFASFGSATSGLPRRAPDAAAARRTSSPISAVVAQHRYRVIGKVRLVLFWIGNDHVGGARLAWRQDGDVRAIALLIGSDPQRAPRGLNEWGYIREEVRPDHADVFGVRSISDADSVDDAEAKLASDTGPARFGALCSNVTATTAASLVTTVGIDRDVTYRSFERLLDAVITSPRWKRRDTVRPAEAEVGFLTATQRLIQASIKTHSGSQRSLPQLRSIAYVYRGVVYDLRLRSVERLNQIEIGPDVFRNLIRGEFSIQNRVTKDVTRFSLTYGTEGALAKVPVRASYQPNWWFKVELELDDRVDVPEDPAEDRAVAQRIHELCERAAIRVE